MRQKCAKPKKAQSWVLTSHRTSIVVRFLTSFESCEVSIRQNKTLYKRLLNMSANPPSERHTPRRESTIQRYKKNFIPQTTE